MKSDSLNTDRVKQIFDQSKITCPIVGVNIDKLIGSPEVKDHVEKVTEKFYQKHRSKVTAKKEDNDKQYF